ncbi:TIGR02450 family Trp-rich protein [Glaciecola siphonariae]|uniref:TIGR02450 family Trp-rich protein n=1 Tax=Glaciecola siphonariae TaxID=521012 RepID=A0ABV9LY07_9ALTE
MNQIHPKKLLHSKWTATHPQNKEKHFAVIETEFNEEQTLVRCVMQAIHSKREFEIEWRDLKNTQRWKTGWV